MKDILKQWNPWWSTGSVPEKKRLIPRDAVLSRIVKLLPEREAVVLSGVRRCGKSTLLYQAIDSLLKDGVAAGNILYLNLDEPLPEKNVEVLDEVLNAYLELKNPQGRLYLFFDEIQGIPRWEQWVKKQYDLRGKELKFILTGSNSSMLSDDLAKLLTGRTLTVNVYPLSFREYLTFKNVVVKDLDAQKRELRHHFARYLTEGGFPESVLGTESDTNVQRLREYFDSILLRDIVASQNVRDSAKLRDLASHAMTNISTLLSYNRISKAIGLNISTLTEYLRFLENAYLIFQAKFFSYSVTETMLVQKPRKIYAIDNGMRNAVSFPLSKDEGRLAENLVFLALRREHGEVYYWKGRGEVDFVIKHRDQTLTAINVSMGAQVPAREKAALEEFGHSFKKVRERVVLTDDVEKEESGIAYRPLWKWALEA